MAIQEIFSEAVANPHPVHLIIITACVSALYYIFLRRPQLNLPVVIPDPGPEGVFNTLTRSYEEVRLPGRIQWSLIA